MRLRAQKGCNLAIDTLGALVDAAGAPPSALGAHTLARAHDPAPPVNMQSGRGHDHDNTLLLPQRKEIGLCPGSNLLLPPTLLLPGSDSLLCPAPA
jgi:hypothetical protein